MIEDYLKKLGLTESESRVFLTFFRLGTQPASVIARQLSMERTTVYKILLRLDKLNLISQTKKHGVTMFYIPDISSVKNFILHKEKDLKELHDTFDTFAAEIQSTYEPVGISIPKITIYDGLDKISNLYKDILREVEKTGYRFLRMFATNTHTEQMSQYRMKDVAKNFFYDLKKNNVVLDSYIADGSLIMERISKRTKVDEILQLPASSSATNIFIIGDSIYLLIFKDEPVGIKIKNQDLAQSFHFIFDKLKIEG